jgi:cytochrome c peroxidase
VTAWPRALATLGMAVAMAIPSAIARPGQLLPFDADERQRIASHGPWPPAPSHDPGNRLAGQPAAIALGHRLFFDHRVSGHGRLACASCHVPALGLADGRTVGQGLAPLDRHTPSLWNAGQARWHGWDGAYDSLWSQALHPLRQPAEMATTADHLRHLLQRDAGLACLARQVMGSEPPAGPDNAADTAARDERLLVGVAKALGAYVGTLVSPRTPFDRFRDALLRGDRRAAARYPLAAQRGLKLFIGRAQCGNCHVGSSFSNGEFGDTGLPFFVRPGVVDPGRHGGIAALRASPYNLLGRHSDAAGGADDPVATPTRHLLSQHRNFGEFKVPGLRNLVHTAPYMHAGQLATLDDVVRHYDRINLDRLHADGEQILKPLQLSHAEAADLVAFLRSLSTPRPPLPQVPPRACTGGAALDLR